MRPAESPITRSRSATCFTAKAQDDALKPEFERAASSFFRTRRVGRRPRPDLACFARHALATALLRPMAPSGASGHLAPGRAPAYLLWVPRTIFLPIANPKLRSAPPAGPDWLHEVKHDGWRAQLHRSSSEVIIFSKNGKDRLHCTP